MKKLHCIMLCLCVAVLCACSDGETYSDQKDREQEVINMFMLSDTHIVVQNEELCHVGSITVIPEEVFLVDTTTLCIYDSLHHTYIANQYVQLNTGMYMQIVRRGAGDMIRPGQSRQLVARYFEYNMSMGYVTSRNTTNDFHRYPDILDVSNTYGTLSGSFNTDINGGGAMYRSYGSKVVPEGWLTPLRYVRVGNQTIDSEGIAKVRLIVPHQLGHSTSTSTVQPYFYEITFEELH